jgi:CO/xanthine dehydrogenase Mo-binding subunit
VLKAAAQKFGWDTRPSPRQGQTGNNVSGRGIAYAQRNGTRVAVIAQVDIDRSTGKIWARKFTVAHDCGQIINPDGLEKCIEGNIVQGISRALWEEVKFDEKNVTSVDWMTYPILDITETPETIDFALINHPELPPTGAVDPAGGRSDRQRHLRRDRGAAAPRAVLAGSRQAGAVVGISLSCPGRSAARSAAE